MVRKSERPSLILSDEGKKILIELSISRTAPVREVERANVLLHYANGLSISNIERQLGVSRPTIYKCIDKALADGVQAGLKDFSHSPKNTKIMGDTNEYGVSLVFTKPREHDLASKLSTPHALASNVANHAILDSIPSSIELSAVQRDILDLIIQGQATIHNSVEPERAILLWNEGVSESLTAQQIGINEETIRILRYRWWHSTSRILAAEKKAFKAFNDLVLLIFRIPNEGPFSDAASNRLADNVRANSANQGKTAEHKELRPVTRAIIEILHNKPKVYGINRSNWTLRSLAEGFEKHYGQRISHTTVGRLLKEAKLSWKKSRKFLTSPDPNYREKVELLLKTLQSLKADEDLFFIDEMGPLQVKRYGGRSYVPQKVTPTHPQNQQSKGSITLYGALSATTNQVTWFYGKSKDSAGIIDLSEVLFNQYHSKSKIYLTWDAASWHGSDELVKWADDLNMWNRASGVGPIIEFVPLPSSAQFLDVIEAVFGAMKRAVIHNSDYQSEEEMKTAISTHFRERNDFFKHKPKRAGKKIWEIDFFQDHNYIKSGNYREW